MQLDRVDAWWRQTYGMLSRNIWNVTCHIKWRTKTTESTVAKCRFTSKVKVVVKIMYVCVFSWMALCATKKGRWYTVEKIIIGEIHECLLKLIRFQTVYLFFTHDIDSVCSRDCFITNNNALQLCICDCWAKWISDWYNVILETRLNITDKLTHTVQSVTNRLHQLTQYFLCTDNAPPTGILRQDHYITTLNKFIFCNNQQNDKIC